MRESLYRKIQEFKPWNEQEEVDKEVILHLLETQEDIFFSKQSHCSYDSIGLGFKSKAQ